MIVKIFTYLDKLFHIVKPQASCLLEPECGVVLGLRRGSGKLVPRHPAQVLSWRVSVL